MPTERLSLPGPRDVRASLDSSDVRASLGSSDVRASLDADDPTAAVAESMLVACPPHPRHGGTRHDPRLAAVSDALPDRIDCLRFDYGPWDRGRGERADARAAVDWAADRYDRVGLFGYSFGGGVALLVASELGVPVAALAPVASLEDGSDVVAAASAVEAPTWVGYGTDDDAVDADPVAEAVRGRGGTVERFDAGHGFLGLEKRVGERVAAFVGGVL